MVTITDPRFALQWHFGLIGDIATVWQEVSGAGVHVGVYDDGMDRSHQDLAANYDASLHYAGIGSDDGRHNPGADGHGTSVAGLIAAAANGVGGVGVAWGASLTSVDYLNDVQNAGDAVLYDALAWTARFDVVNQSYGVLPEFSDDWDVGDPGSYGWEEAQRYEAAVATGRGGLGTILVKAAGNEANDPDLASLGILGNAQGEGHNVLHTVIVVGAVGRDGGVEDYSNFGANLLVSAPAGSHTTDITGSAGYAPGAYTNDFGGTSAAAPVVSGVVALMLETAPGLGWRDVQAILALSAGQTGSAYGGAATGFEAGEWQAMGGSAWNGGALSFSMSYGFGLVDAFAAVRMAETWLMMHDGIAATDATLERIDTTRRAPQLVSDARPAEITLTVSEGIVIEHVYVTVEMTHSFAADLTITLVAPDGTEVTLAEGDGGGTAVNGDWTFGVAALRGMSSDGTWTLRVTDGAAGDSGTLTRVGLEFLGSPESADDIWTFTDDFPALAAAEPARRSATDGNGGTDWISTVAVARDVVVRLGDSASVAVAGASWATVAGGIENAATGDGDDLLAGAAGDNVLYAGRGRDLVTGFAGADTLMGGPGGDILQGGGNGLWHTEISAQVYRLYLATLGRVPDVGGHQAWVQALTLEQRGLGQVAAGFTASPEFQRAYGGLDDAGFVTLLYGNVLGRAPSPTDLGYWVGRLEDGLSRAAVVVHFSESPEHVTRTEPAQQAYDAAHDITEWADDVYRLYRAVLGREPDAGGFESWAGMLAAGQRTLAQAVAGFMASPEFQATYGAAADDRAFVTLLYENVLGRAPDPAGLDGWVARLEAGMDRVKLVGFFMASAEFVAQTAADLVAFVTGQGPEDVLQAGGGDVLSGGLWVDSFVFAGAEDPGPVTVTDLEPWDRLVFDAAGPDAAEIHEALRQQGDDVVLELAGTSVVFLDTELSEIGAGMIFLA